LLNDTVTRFTEYYGLALGIIILVFALGLRRGLLDVVLDGWRRFSSTHAGTKPATVSKSLDMTGSPQTHG
jgi:branched-chain amino acid transport system permease protein